MNTNLYMNKIMGVATPIMLAWCSFTPPMHPPCMMHLAPLHRMPSCATSSKHPTSKQHTMASFIMRHIWYIYMAAVFLLSMPCNEEYWSRSSCMHLEACKGVQGRVCIIIRHPRPCGPILLSMIDKGYCFLICAVSAPTQCVHSMLAPCSQGQRMTWCNDREHAPTLRPHN